MNSASDSADTSTEKLGVFVSSTVVECAEERAAAKRAIASVNHRPVLFEAIGARPHPPRSVYLGLMEQVQVFVGIYKSSYGWVGPGMIISGVEDEFREATTRGLPRLVYIMDVAGERDERLGKLLGEFEESGEFKYARCANADELYSLVRDDVTALVTERFTPFPRGSPEHGDDAANFLQSTSDPRAPQIVREGLLQEIAQTLSGGPCVCITGPMGSGKSIALAQFATQPTRGAGLYANCANMTSKDALAKCASMLRKHAGDDIRSCPDMPSARIELRAAVAATDDFVLVVDACAEPDILVEIFASAAATQPRKKLCFSARVAPSTYRGHSVPIPPLSEAELRLIARDDGVDREELMARSGGNPLYVRYFLAAGQQYFDSLAAYELRAVAALPPRARELCTYTALASTGLTLSDASALLGVESVEEVVAMSRECEGLVLANEYGYVIFHDHLRDTITTDIESDAARRSFYGGRLGRRYAKRSRFLEAFEAFEFARSDQAERFAGRAAFDAGIRGDMRRAEYVLERQLAYARSRGDVHEEARVLVNTSKVREIAGSLEKSRIALTSAAALARTLDDMELQKAIEERLTVLEAHRGADATALGRLGTLRDQYAKEGDKWSAGRLSLELSVILIHSAEYEQAAKESKLAHEWFEATGDEHGISLAERNLASAYVASDNPEWRRKGAEILQRIEAALAKEPNLRQKAWALNLRTRQARLEGKPSTAIDFAREAIAIGERLGDAGVIRNNRVNMGNALADAGRLEEAFSCYKRVAELAVTSGDVRAEAHALRLEATTLNKLGRASEARLAALKAKARAGACQARSIAADASDEVGDALVTLKEFKAAGVAYLEASRDLAGDFARRQYRSYLALLGMRLLARENALDELRHRIDEVFVSPEQLKARPEGLSALEVDIDRARAVAIAIDPSCAAGCQLVIARALLRGATPNLQAAVVRVLARKLLIPGMPPEQQQAAMLSIASLLTIIPPSALTLHDLVELGDLLAGSDPTIHFRPMSDGAASWLVHLNWGASVLCAVRQLDDRQDTFIATWGLVALLKYSETALTQQLPLESERAGREVIVWLVNDEEVTALIPGAQEMLSGMEGRLSGVSRPTVFEKGDLAPTFVICRSGIADAWALGSSRPSAFHDLYVELIPELMYILYSGQVDLEVLRPKIASIAGRLVVGGPSKINSDEAPLSS